MIKPSVSRRTRGRGQRFTQAVMVLGRWWYVAGWCSQNAIALTSVHIIIKRPLRVAVTVGCGRPVQGGCTVPVSVMCKYVPVHH